MKHSVFALLFAFLIFMGCTTHPNSYAKWWPYVGCPQKELVDKWGRAPEAVCPLHRGAKRTWYTKSKNGGVYPGYRPLTQSTRILIHIEDEKITAISCRH